MKVSLTSNDLIQAVFLKLNNKKILRDDYFIDKSILFAQNYNIDDLNKHDMQRIFKVLCIYFKVDVAIVEDGTNNSNYYPIKYLNSFNISRLPPFSLKLQIRCPIMLWQNIASY